MVYIIFVIAAKFWNSHFLNKYALGEFATLNVLNMMLAPKQNTIPAEEIQKGNELIMKGN